MSYRYNANLVYTHADVAAVRMSEGFGPVMLSWTHNTLVIVIQPLLLGK